MSYSELFKLDRVLEITRPPEPYKSSEVDLYGCTNDATSLLTFSDQSYTADTNDPTSILEGVHQDIKRVCFKDYGQLTVLVLYCSNGHLIYRLTQIDRATKIRIIRWFQGCWICDMCLSPESNWLLVACSHSCLKMVPVLSILIDNYQSGDFTKDPRDVTTIINLRQYGRPTCVCWWDVKSGNNYGIVGFQKGIILFVDIPKSREGSEVTKIVDIGAGQVPRELQLMKSQHNQKCGLLISTTSRSNIWLLLEKANCKNTSSASSQSDSNVQFKQYSTGSEATPYIDTISNNELTTANTQIPSTSNKRDFTGISANIITHYQDSSFLPQPILEGHQILKLYPQRQMRRSYLAILDSNKSKLLLYQDVDLLSKPLLEYVLPKRTYDVILADNILYAISSKGNNMYLNVLSSQQCSLLARKEEEDANPALVYQAKLPSHVRIRKIFPMYSVQPHSQYGFDTTGFIECLIVSRYEVFLCRQVMAPEDLFVKFALNYYTLDKADHLGITLHLDICTLYEKSAELHLEQGNYSLSLYLFKLAKTNIDRISARLLKYSQFDLLIGHLKNELLSADCSDIEVKSNTLFHLLIGKLLNEPMAEEKLSLELEIRRFFHTNQHYNECQVLKVLMNADMESMAVDMALVNGIIQEFVCLSARKSRFALKSSTINKILFTRFGEMLARLCNGAFQQHIQLSTQLQLIIKFPDTVGIVVDLIREKLHTLPLEDLLRLAVIFDPSQDFVKHLLLTNSNSRNSVYDKKNRFISSNDSYKTVTSTITIGATNVNDDKGAALLDNSIDTILNTPPINSSTSTYQLSATEYFELFIEILLWINRVRSLSQNDDKSMSLNTQLFVFNTVEYYCHFLPSYTLPNCNSRFPTITGTHTHCGHAHAGFLLKQQLFMWTVSKDQILNPQAYATSEVHPKAVPIFSFLHIKVLSFSCGQDHAIAGTLHGIYAWGDNQWGQLGLGDRLSRVIPSLIDDLSQYQIISINCGHDHTLVIDDRNYLFAFGRNTSGQLGIGSRQPFLLTPNKLDVDFPIINACGGSQHSLIMSIGGALYSMGDNSEGQLGVDNINDSIEPVLIDSLSPYKIVIMSCGSYSSAASPSGLSVVFFWGRGLHSDNNTDYSTLPSHHPTPLKLDLERSDRIASVSLGLNHSLLLTKNGRVYSWGCNHQGQCGLGNTENQPMPKLLSTTDVDFISVSAGDCFSAAIDSSYKCYLWGRLAPETLSTLPKTPSPSHEETPKRMHFQDNNLDDSEPLVLIPKTIPDLKPEWNLSILTDSERDATSELTEQMPDLPDFSFLGDSPYDKETLNSSLRVLYTHYSSYHILNLAENIQNLNAMSIIMELNKDMPRALEYKLRHLSRLSDIQVPYILENVCKYIDSQIQQHVNYYTTHVSFVREAILMIKSLAEFWLSHSISFQSLEDMLERRIIPLSYPLHLFITENSTNQFSIHFCSKVTMQVVKLIAEGHPSPNTLVNSNEKIIFNSVTNNTNEEILWGHVVHNLTKEINNYDSFKVDMSRIPVKLSNSKECEFILFSCGHYYSGAQFQTTVLPNFKKLLHQSLPTLDNTVSQSIIDYYYTSEIFQIGCPACFYLSLQKVVQNSQ